MPPFRKMLVALSGQQTDEGLLRYAALLGEMLPSLETLGIHVLDAAAATGSKARSGDLAEVVKTYLPRAACDVIAGDVLDSILDAAVDSGCDLILLGHKQSAGHRRSLARRLAMKAPCSVWMAPSQSPPSVRRILVPVDFSTRSADSLEVATAIAAAAGLDECIALHVYFNQAVVTFKEFDEILIENTEKAFGLFIAPIDLHGVYAKPLFVEASNVANTILRVATERQCDLIVMGSRGRSASAAVLLGSETEQALMRATVPLLTVKRFGARMRLLQALRDERVRKRASSERYI